VITTEENVIHRIYMTENTVPIRFAVSNDGDAIVKISAINLNSFKSLKPSDIRNVSLINQLKLPPEVRK